jgi:Fe-S-cluster containining protein
MTFRPRLRPEIELVVDDGKPSIWDPLSGRLVAAGAITRVLVEELAASAGERTVDELIARVAERKPDARVDDIRGAFRGLMLLSVIEGTGEAVRARLAAMVRDAVPAAIVPLAGTRFGCQGTGQCCRVFDVPLSESDIARLESLDLAREFPELGGSYYDQRPTIADPRRTETYLGRRHSRCVFLQPGERCGLHAKFGPESKPTVCRIFPWRTLLTTDGLKVFDQGECGAFAVSARTGDRLEDQLGWILPLLPKHPTLYHPVALLGDGMPCDYGWVLELIRSSSALVDHARPTGPTLLGLATLARKWGEAVGGCPLEAGEPDRSSAAALSVDPASIIPAAVPPAPVDGWVGLIRICDALCDAYEEERDALGPLTAWVTQALGHARAAIAHQLDPAQFPCPGEILAAAALPLDQPDIDEVLRLCTRGYVFGDGYVVGSYVASSVLRLALVDLVAISGARILAYQRGDDRARAKDLSFSISSAMTVFRRPVSEQVIAAHEPMTWDIVSAIADYVAGPVRATHSAQ